MFELRHRDAMGRLGTLEACGKRMETPALLPVVSPKLQKIKPRELRRMGFEGVITNSNLIHRDEGLREKALQSGVHKLLDYDGLVMTDSGSYQLYEYGRVEIGAREIVEFQDGTRYGKRANSAFTTHTVMVEDPTDVIDHDAEGYMQVKLRSVPV